MGLGAVLVVAVVSAEETPYAAPAGQLFVRVDDPDGALALEAQRLGLSPGQFVRRELARARWLREALSRGGRVLTEDDRGHLREVRYPGKER